MVPNPSGRSTQLFSVAAPTTNDAWAVGTNCAANAGLVVQHWDGKRKSSSLVTIQTPPGSTFNQILQLSSAAPSTLIGVGSTSAGNGLWRC